jgi:serine/threonine protein kinase/Tol biopolymer transport system component
LPPSLFGSRSLRVSVDRLALIDRLSQLAEAVADGRTLDWDALESSASDDAELESIRRLRAIAAIGFAHSELTVSQSLSESLSVRAQLQGVVEQSTPATWGPLRILERVGRGRFGDVYRAWDPNLDRQVALKLHRHRDIDARGEHREVVEEGRLMARVRHPNVVTIHGAQRIDGRTGLWMEFIEGRTLEAELSERGPFPAEEIRRVGVELSRALAAVHDAGLVHRDVKAQNVLRDKSGRILLGDFGTGHELDDEGIGPASIAGTPAYLAPEIFAGSAATPRSDIYSLGVLLFRLATGTYPVTGRSVSQIRDAHRDGSRATLASLRSDLPTALVAVINKALDPEPALRFESAKDIESALTGTTGPVVIDQNLSIRKWSLAVTIVVALAGALAWNVRNSGEKDGGNEAQAGLVPGRPNARVFRQIGGSDLAQPGAPSPNGRLLSFPRKGELWFHEVATGKQWQVTSDASGDPRGNVFDSRFSDEGTRVFYLRFTEQATPDDPRIPEIRSISTSGGQSRLIWRWPDTRSVNFYHWAGAGDLILAGRWPEQGPGELLVIDTVRSRIHSTLPGVTQPSLTGASLSPDGRYVAFEQTDRATGFPDIHIWQVGTTLTAPLIEDASSDHSPVFTPDGRYVLFMSNRSGSGGLWAQRVDNVRSVGAPIRLDPNVGVGWPMGGLTNDGSLFMRRQMGTRDVFTVDIDPVSLRLLNDPRRVSGRPLMATGTSAWSPDGRSLAFFRNDGYRRTLVVHSLRENREREFWRPGVGGLILPRWEPDGRSVLFKGTVDRAAGLHRLVLESGTFETVLPRNLNEYEPLPAPGYIILSDRGKRAVVRVDLRTGREEVIHRVPPPGFLRDMGLSHSGNRLAYSYPLGGNTGVALRILDLATPTTAREIFRTAPKTGLEAYGWSLDDREVIAMRTVNAAGVVDEKDHLWAIDVATGSARPIGLTVDNKMQRLQISPDGRRLSYDAGYPYQEVWVLENAAALLPQ